MANAVPKVSFGFKKTAEKPKLVKNNVENVKETKKIEMIGSIEGTTIKVIGKNDKNDGREELVIPLTNAQKTRPLRKLMQDKGSENGEAMKIDVNETLEQKAAREIIEDLKNTRIKTESKVLELPIHPDKLPLNGAIESTADDYEKIPISDFGKAMLRGMGWKDEENKELNKFDVPVVRPKGLGLGADKVIKKQKLLVAPAVNETLEIKRNACVKILAGKHKNLYGTIEGFDDGGGRLIVKLAIGGLKVLMNEFMVQPVPKQEYAKYSKILNAEKYEDFKNDESKTSSTSSRSIKEERRSRSFSPSTSRGRDESYRSRDDNRRNKSHERNGSNYNRKDTQHYSSDSEDDKTNNRKYNERRRRSRSHEKHRKRYSSSDSSSERHRSKKKSSKKSSKSKSKKHDSPNRHHSSDDERKHKRKYKRSKHHRDRS